MRSASNNRNVPLNVRLRACRPAWKGAAAWIIAGVLLFGFSPSARAQSVFAGTATRSHSGQFVVLGAGSSSSGAEWATNDTFIALQPTLLAVSCERIKDSLYRELNVRGPWHGTVYLKLRPALSPEDPITVVSERLGNRWSYRVELPDTVDKRRYAGVIVRVLLLELARRDSRNGSLTIPAWLADGLAEQLIASSAVEIFLPPAGALENGLSIRRINFDSQMPNPLASAKRILDSRPPLTFDQLGWPDDSQLSGEDGGVFRASAQLFVNGLTGLSDGRDCLRTMVMDLPRYLNWQLAFLNAFHAHFDQPLAVEKWWALQLVRFSGRDLSRLLTARESRRQLDDIIYCAADVRTASDILPRRTDVTLQTILREWNSLEQNRVLRLKLRQLDLLRLQAAQELVPLVDDYRLVIGNYLQSRSTRGSVRPGGGKVDLPDLVTGETIKQLDALDARRTFRPPDARLSSR